MEKRKRIGALVEVRRRKKTIRYPPRVYFPPSTPLNPIPVGRGAHAAAVGRDATSVGRKGCPPPRLPPDGEEEGADDGDVEK